MTMDRKPPFGTDINDDGKGCMTKDSTMKLLAMLMVVFLFGGCRILDGKMGRPSAKNARPVEVKAPVYHQFKDILIPGDFKEKRKYSSVTGKGDSATGFVSFYGPVDLTSAVNFFSIRMLSDGWGQVTMAKTPLSTILVFNKAARWCTIELSETNFTTDLKIAVSLEISRPESFVKPEAVPVKPEDLGEPRGLIEPSGVIEE